MKQRRSKMAELEDVTLDGKPLHSLRVADLKAALEQRGLAKSGQKNALIKRLKGALMLENLQRTSTSHIGLQPNSQIGEEMSQNSFIKQYLAKQQELLRQRMEREAREAAEADDVNSPAGPDEDDHSSANDGNSYLPDKHHIMASHPSMSKAEVDDAGDRMRGLPQEPGIPGACRLDVGPAPVAQEPIDVSAGRIWRPSFSQEEAATPSPPRAVASLSVRVVGQPDSQGVPLIVSRPQESEGTPVEAGPAHSMPAQLSRSAIAPEESGDDDDEDDDDEDDSDKDDEWGPSHGRKNAYAPPAHRPAPASSQRSRRKLQPPQHIPPLPQPAHHQSPLQLRQPTPPPSPPPELSFPLPDTPKQSPPDQDEPAGPGEGAAPGSESVSSPPSLPRRPSSSSSSSRSSSPEPPSQRRPGPLSLLVRKMESEGAFGEGEKKEEEDDRDGDGTLNMEAAEQEESQEETEPKGVVASRVTDDANTSCSSVVAEPPVEQHLAQEELPGLPPPPQISEPLPTLLSTDDGSNREMETEMVVEKERSPQRQKEDEKKKGWNKEKEDKQEESDTTHLSPRKCGPVPSPTRVSTHFHCDSPTSSPPPPPPPPPPPVARRPRVFSEVPPPECLITPSRPEQVSVVVSAPRHADPEVAMETEASAAEAELIPEKAKDEEMKPQAEPDEQASPRAARAAEDSKKPPSALPPSPPEETEEREGETEERRSSSSSSSSSSDSDSESSSSSSSGSTPRDKSSPPRRKKDKEETARADDSEEESGKSPRDVKQAAVAEPTGPVAMELEERPESENAVAQPAPQGVPEATESRPDESTTPKAFAARKILLTTTKPEGTALEVESGGAASRKRRWGSSTAVTAKKPSISITTESLKSLIPDIKPLQEAVVELHPDEGRFSGDEDSNQQGGCEEDQGLKIRRTVTQVVPSEGQENGQKEKEEDEEDEEEEDEEQQQAGGDKERPHKKARRESVSEVTMETEEGDAKKVTPNDSLVRRSISQQKVGVSITVDDPVRTNRQLSPPRGKVSNIIHVCNLVRPFTLGQLKELLNRTGTVVEEGFWIDKIKSHCYVTYSSAEEAVATREALHGVKWPSSNPKVLRVDFCEQDELDFHKGLLTGEDPRAAGPAGRPAGPPLPPPLMPPSREREKERERDAGGASATAAAAAPPPVRDQWAEREREMERRERTRLEREWDRDKVRDFSREDRDATRRSRSRDAARRSRSRDRDRRRKERGKSKERRLEKKDKPEEPPAKLLDDLFRKTKAAPCIYWLPLTEEQAAQRTQERAERMKEREKRRKELEEEEKKREEERKERARGRDRASDNTAGGAGGGAGQPAERERDREREKEKEKEKERERGREREAEKRRDSNRGRAGDSKPAGASRRSRSRSRRSRSRSPLARERRR